MTPDIHFHGLEKSDAIEAKVRDKVAKLHRHFDRMSSCRVVLEAPQRNAAKAKQFRVKIEISVPNSAAIIVSHDREGASANEDLPLAIRDAFEAAMRKVDELGDRRANRGRAESSRRRPAADEIEQ
jgi:putative sigma-54 modulation protein